MRDLLLLHGTEVQRVTNGTKSIMNSLKVRFEKGISTRVNNADHLSRRNMAESFVPINANPPGGEPLALMMSRECVNTVGVHTMLINIQNQKLVQDPALIDSEHRGVVTSRPKSIMFVGYEDVYNMEVEGYHNFAVNEGIIVHNCIDSVRYGLEADMTRRRTKIRNKAKTIGR